MEGIGHHEQPFSEDRSMSQPPHASNESGGSIIPSNHSIQQDLQNKQETCLSVDSVLHSEVGHSKVVLTLITYKH